MQNSETTEQDVLSSLDLMSLYRSEVAEFSGPDKAGLCRAVCPFCYDDRRTFYIIADNGNFNCFGCGTKGSFINFMTKTHEASRDEILEVLAAVSKTEPGADLNDIQMEEDLRNSDVTISSGDKRNGKQKGGFRMQPELYLSPAFLSLKKNSIKVLIALMDMQAASGVDEIEASYGHFVSVFKINRGSLPRAFDELMGKGFVQLIHHGGIGKGDRNLYKISNRYLSWEVGADPFELRPKRENQWHQNNALVTTNERPTDLSNVTQEVKRKPLGEQVTAYFRTLKEALGTFI